MQTAKFTPEEMQQFIDLLNNPNTAFIIMEKQNDGDDSYWTGALYDESQLIDKDTECAIVDSVFGILSENTEVL